MLSSAWVSSGALSGTPTNVTLSVAHKDDSMNAKAPIVAANSGICTTPRAEITQPSWTTEVVVTLSTSNKTARCYGGEAPRGGKADQGDEVRPLDPPLDPLTEGDGRQKERQDRGRSLYQGHCKPTASIVECLEMLEGPEVPTQDAEGEHANERPKPHRDPELGA